MIKNSIIINLYALCLNKDKIPSIKILLSDYSCQTQLIKMRNKELYDIYKQYEVTNYIQKKKKIEFSFSKLFTNALDNEISLSYFNDEIKSTNRILTYVFGSKEPIPMFIFKSPNNNSFIIKYKHYRYTFNSPIFHEVINSNLININQESLIYIIGNELIYQDNDDAKQLLKFIIKS